MTEREVLESLIERLSRASVTCANMQVERRKDLMSTQATSLLNDINADVSRLGGKVEGIQVALSYIHEELRNAAD